MPFISTEEVKEIRQALKKALPGFKLSVRKEDYSSLCVAFLAGPVDLGEKYVQVSPYHLNNFSSEARKALETALEAIDSIKPKYTEHEDGDYGSIPNYYRHIEIGKWNKPYEKRA